MTVRSFEPCLARTRLCTKPDNTSSLAMIRQTHARNNFIGRMPVLFVTRQLAIRSPLLSLPVYIHTNTVVKEENMAEKDLSEKILLNYNDVFSDIVNVLLFDGKEIVSPNALEDQIVHAQYKASDGLHEEERDIFKKIWGKGKHGVAFALCGIENQTSPYRYMPARVIGYDGAAYREQLLDKHVKRIIPVVTIVLNFGTSRWRDPTSLKELFADVSPALEPYLNDYRIFVFDVAWLSEETVRKFKGDFRVVANFFVKRRTCGDEYAPDDPTDFEHVDAVLKLLSVMTGDRRYETILSEKVEVKNMCEVAERLEQKGIEKGIEIGRAESRAEALERATRNYMEMEPGISYDEAKKKAEYILR